MGVEALEAPVARRAADAGVELGPQLLLDRLSPAEALRQLGIVGGGLRPALDAPGGLDAGERRHEVAAAEPELGRERVPFAVERLLLDDGRQPEGAAHRDTAKRPRHTPELALDNLQIVHRPRLVQCDARQAETPRTMKSCSPGFTNPSRRASRTRSAPVPTVASRDFSCRCSIWSRLTSASRFASSR